MIDGDHVDPTTRLRLIREHLDQIARLENESQPAPASNWPPKDYYLLFHVVVGMMLGLMGGVVSLMLNVLGSLLLRPDQHPLRLIQVYLTFPMGEQALAMQAKSNEGLLLFVGCCLYLATGAVYGVLFHVVMSRYFSAASAGKRFVVASVIGLALWIINFYFVLSWLQPLLQGGNWIIREVPFWVAAATHLAYAWTMLLAEVWGKFEHGIEPRPSLADSVKNGKE